MSTYTEIQILEGCRKGKESYQELLYKLYYSYGMSVSLRYACVRDEAIEILNDAFMKVFDNIDRFDSKQSFKPWFRQILVNTAIDYIRKNSKSRYFTEPEVLTEAEPDVIDSLNAEDILKLLSTLPETYRTIFNLYEIEGYSHDEIADKMGIPAGTSRSYLTRAKKILRDAYIKLYQNLYYEAI